MFEDISLVSFISKYCEKLVGNKTCEWNTLHGIYITLSLGTYVV
jgi:hypothetical protein